MRLSGTYSLPAGALPSGKEVDGLGNQEGATVRKDEVAGIQFTEEKL